MPIPSPLTLRDYGPSHGSHSHAHFQVLVGVQGTLELEVEGRGHAVNPGDGLIVGPGERHDFESRHGSRCLVLDTADPVWARRGGQPGPQIGLLAKYLAAAIEQRHEVAALRGPALLWEAWAPALPALRPRRGIDWQALSLWVQARLDRPITVAELAARVHLSTSQFTLRCHEAHGTSPQAWLRMQRLARARRLRDGGMAVAEVARRSGYRSPSALTAALRRDARR
jgi:AraC-like DNA-binding protein